MKLLGVVAEYNPFHNGHEYLLSEARAKSGADCIVVAMSGNFTQRGEPAILDKWDRTELALYCGADIVLEIPVAYVLADAGQYGKAGVELLKGFGCDAIAFGSENGDINALRRVAANLENFSEALDGLIADNRNSGLSYPAARQSAYAELFADSSDIEEDISILSSSNDILALEYIRAAHGMELFAIKREGAAYSDGIDDSALFQSATGIRQNLKNSEGVSRYVPKCCDEKLNGLSQGVFEKREKEFYSILKYSLLKEKASSIEESPSGGEGLANRLKSAALSAESVSEIIEFVKSKRYTYTRISRLLSQVVLGIRRDDVTLHVTYARLLGFNVTGRKALADIKKREANTLPVITNINKETEEFDEKTLRMLELDGLAVDIYNLIDDRSLYSNSDRVHKPVIIQK